MRDNPTMRDVTLTTTVGVAPYALGEIRYRKGIRQTAFHAIIGQKGKVLKVHNTYLKPFYLESALDEYWAMRNAAGLFDVTGEEVIEVSGPDALPFLNELVTRDVGRMADGQCLYAIMCYDYGGIVEDGILVRFSAERFWWVGGMGYSEQWLYGHSIGRNVAVRSRLDRTHIASLQGPKSRDMLQRVVKADLSTVPFYGMVETEVCGIPSVVTRTGYTTELGYEIYVDVERGETVFAGLWEACRDGGGRLGGSATLHLRRVEAGLIDFTADFDWHHTPYQVGLGWMLNMKKGFFHGREALSQEAARTPATRLAGLKLDGEEPALKGEKVLVDGVPVGEITSSVRGPSLQATIAIAMIGSAHCGLGQKVEVLMGERRVAGQVVATPFFDPERKLARA